MPVSERLPSYLTPSAVRRCLTQALDEDLGTGDVTSEAIIPPDAHGIASFELRESGVVAGMYIAKQVCQLVDPNLVVQWDYADGDFLPGDLELGTVRGPLRSLMVAERLALNFMQRMSGIATFTHQMVKATNGFPACIRDTRKTAPGLRLLDKWAVLLGGGTNHRIGLYDRILIKDNHIAAAGSLKSAVMRASAYSKGIPVDVEARTLDEVREALDLADDIELVLLDNMVRRTEEGGVDTTLLNSTVELIDGRMLTEASGNVSLESVRDIAATGVDFISCGALTHSMRALDIGLKLH